METLPGIRAILEFVMNPCRYRLYFLVLALSLFSTVCDAQSAFDRGRRPVQIVRTDAAQVRALYAARIEIDSMTSEGIRVWVDDRQLDWLTARGWTIHPLHIPKYTPPPPDEKGAALSYPLTVYPTYDQITEALQGFVSTYPSLCRLESIGQSGQGRELWFLKITDNPDVEEQEPELKYVSTMHGNETLGTVLMLNLIHRLLSEYGSVSRVTDLVNSNELWIMPLLNPDGYQIRSRYNSSGIDLNRDFPDRVDDPEPSPIGRELETQAMIRFSTAHTFALSANFHTGSLVVNYPYDNSEFRFVFNHPDWYSPDDDFFIAQSLAYSTPNSPMFNNPEFPQGITNGISWYSLSGGMQDWNYVWMGCNEVTIELSNTFEPATSNLPTLWSQNQESLLAYLEMARRGIRGRVTSSRSGAPVGAQIQVIGRDHAVYSDPEVGDFYRLLLPGEYDIRVEAPGFRPVVVADVEVEDSTPTRVDVALEPIVSMIRAR